MFEHCVYIYIFLIESDITVLANDACVQVSVFVRARVSKGWTLFAAGSPKQSMPEVTNFHCITQEIQLLYDNTHPNNTSSFVLRAACFRRETMFSRNLKNVLVVSVGFLFLFTANGGLQNLQVGRFV